MKVDPHSSNPYFSKSTCICFICQLFYSDFIKGNKSVHHRLAQMQSVHLSRPQFYNNKVGVMPGMFCLTDPRQTPTPPLCLSHTHKWIYTHTYFFLSGRNRCPNSWEGIFWLLYWLFMKWLTYERKKKLGFPLQKGGAEEREKQNRFIGIGRCAYIVGK